MSLRLQSERGKCRATCLFMDEGSKTNRLGNAVESISSIQYFSCVIHVPHYSVSLCSDHHQ